MALYKHSCSRSLFLLNLCLTVSKLALKIFLCLSLSLPIFPFLAVSFLLVHYYCFINLYPPLDVSCLLYMSMPLHMQKQNQKMISKQGCYDVGQGRYNVKATWSVYHQTINLFSLLYQFPMVPVVSYDKFSSLKQHFFFLTVLKAECPKSRCQQSCKGPRRILSSFFQLLVIAGNCWYSLVLQRIRFYSNLCSLFCVASIPLSFAVFSSVFYRHIPHQTQPLP